MDGGNQLQKGFVPYSGEPDGWFTTRPQNNIGNLRYGSIDSVITSPPYEGIEARDRSKEQSFERERSGKYPRRGDLNISKGYSVDLSLIHI